MTPLELHKSLLKLRRGEELLARLYGSGEMKTPCHFSTGQEAISVGVVAALDLTKDICVTHHRSHAAFLACNGDFFALASEIYGRETGCSKGRGGSVHLTSRETGFLASSAILAQMVPVAVGIALSFKMDKKDAVAVCFTGEAAMEEGVYYEAMNYAALYKLPVIFVIENNQWSTESPLSTRQPKGTQLCERAKTFKFKTFRIDGNNVDLVFRVAEEARIWATEWETPVLIECDTMRFLEHVGCHTDEEMGRTYRSAEDLAAWKLKCPVKRSYENLISLGHSPEELNALDHDIQAELVEQALRAREAPFPGKADLLMNVW